MNSEGGTHTNTTEVPDPEQGPDVRYPNVSDGGPWRGPSLDAWLVHISKQSTPAGESIPWIKASGPCK